MLLRVPTSVLGFTVLLGCANTGPATAAHETAPGAPLSNTTHCEPLPEDPWLQLSPGGTPEVVANVLDSHRCDFRVIDVRKAKELTSSLGIIEGAEHIPQRELVGDATTWDPEQPIVLVCRSGRRSGRLARELREAGLPQVASLTGGMIAWNAAGHPIVSGQKIVPRSSAYPHPTTMRSVTRADVVRHVADRDHLHWTKAASLLLHGTQACVDGRDAHAIAGTPGGDAGELILALSAAEQLSERRFTREEIVETFDAYLEAFGHFYMHSDDHAVAALVDSLASVDSHDAAIALLRAPDPALREDILAHIAEPEFVGCGHLRLMLTYPEDYGVRRELVEAVVATFFERLWVGHPALEFVVLEGRHHESAVVEIQLDTPTVHAYTQIPLVSPRLEDTEVFVHHPQVARFIRHQNVSFLLERVPLLRGSGLDESSFFEVLETLADRQTATTMSHLAAGLPVYTLRFSDQSFDVVGPTKE